MDSNPDLSGPTFRPHPRTLSVSEEQRLAEMVERMTTNLERASGRVAADPEAERRPDDPTSKRPK
jgi:hypothetical protein